MIYILGIVIEIHNVWVLYLHKGVIWDNIWCIEVTGKEVFFYVWTTPFISILSEGSDESDKWNKWNFELS